MLRGLVERIELSQHQRRQVAEVGADYVVSRVRE
ncbi:MULTISPECIES: hypothetical protein [Halomonas]|nr:MULTISPECIES: hypothetical protein [Halomonas]MDR5890643.1 hypothetical protein [Halomonas salina]WJY05995.1 hypothetical protein QWG60_09730 [Halomonas halophila]